VALVELQSPRKLKRKTQISLEMGHFHVLLAFILPQMVSMREVWV
jgi:hypothetical protein|tara:strand:+ start:451 stop:585 length:135 start_codon:yes stop_codon:yes gene_type:complete